MSHTDTLIVITGPTATGKSALAVDVAETLGTEILSADSRQIYRHMPIVTAVPTPEEQSRVAHHFVEILEPHEYYSAALYEEQALSKARGLIADRGVAVAVGGSMMYIDALCHGIDELPAIPEEIRQQLRHRLDNDGPEAILATLRELDPAYYAQVDRKNLKRVVHAVEICLAAGVPYSSLRTGRRRQRGFKVLKYMLDAPRDLLFERINRRVERMVEAGLAQEAEALSPMRHLNALNTVGLKEMFMWMDGLMDFDTAVARIKKNTRVYAKKQLTWFRRDPEITRLDITAGGNPLDRILADLAR